MSSTRKPSKHHGTLGSWQEENGEVHRKHTKMIITTIIITTIIITTIIITTIIITTIIITTMIITTIIITIIITTIIITTIIITTIVITTIIITTIIITTIITIIIIIALTWKFNMDAKMGLGLMKFFRLISSESAMLDFWGGCHFVLFLYKRNK